MSMNCMNVESEISMNEIETAKRPIVIQAQGLCKSYRKHNSTASRLVDFVNYFLRRRRSPRFFKTSHVLSNVDLTVRKGYSLGIIGQNGGGKSTLLKMVASIISPTGGELQVNGRVASIIELGAGFNPEDTGLQNIKSYLTMYDIPYSAFAEKIDKIVEFSGLGDKVSAPVKTYSSGMTVRLAFAIIAHLDADILLVDEALAVGDAVFSQKCMRYIKAFKEHGTILFVSHDLNALQNLCDEVIWLHDGVVRQRGLARPVCEAYLEFTLSKDYPEFAGRQETTPSSERSKMKELSLDVPGSTIKIGSEQQLDRGFGGEEVEILDVSFRSTSGESCRVIAGGEAVELAISVRAKAKVMSPVLGFLVKNNRGVEIFGENTLHDLKTEPLHFEPFGQYEAVFRFVFPILPSGDYTVSVAVADGDFFQHQQLVWRHDVLVLRVASERFRYGLIGLSGTNVSVYQDKITSTKRKLA
ncbi:ABC transporter ATP-binding protein [Thalassospira sp. A3_1]|uniref:ABC transporter ATP-binding protein n=1 Tax=Thalassospira sp. A3_1 TaxID=2821088 RepID=UPI001ADA2403|nr:ABC transporter ATP-binding protein [Thalassospira sp. A3_1]MBO9506225.1 ABC transporter ATP-binding protein [Thalassospira sp. A3_1]